MRFCRTVLRLPGLRHGGPGKALQHDNRSNIVDVGEGRASYHQVPARRKKTVAVMRRQRFSGIAFRSGERVRRHDRPRRILRPVNTVGVTRNGVYPRFALERAGQREQKLGVTPSAPGTACANRYRCFSPRSAAPPGLLPARRAV